MADAELTVDRVPESADPWMPFAEFALSFDGYAYRDDLGMWANRQAEAFHRTGSLPDGLTLSDLRALAFFEQRRFRHFGTTPEGDDLRYIQAVLAEIRRRVDVGEG